MEYRAILRDTNVSVSSLPFHEQNKLINALHAAYSAGYSAGWWQALQNNSDRSISL